MNDIETYTNLGMAYPGASCPFAGGLCQPLCWAWEFEENDKRCFAFDDMPDGLLPGQWYHQCVMEVLRP